MSENGTDRDGPRTKRCEECNDEFVTEPDWADRHVHVEIRWAGGTGMEMMDFCSTECAARSLRTETAQDGDAHE